MFADPSVRKDQKDAVDIDGQPIGKVSWLNKFNKRSTTGYDQHQTRSKKPMRTRYQFPGTIVDVE